MNGHGSNRRLHLGAGNEILPGWTNHDLVQLPGIDVAHDLSLFPWPFENNSFDEIRMVHVLEHLPETIRTVEEVHRIAAPDATVTIRVPYWNSPDMISDPTHKAFFNEYSFDYFDPVQRHCQERPYYSTARFQIRSKIFYTKVLRYREVKAVPLQRALTLLARHLNGVIWVIEFDLVALKR
jgi:predicted SAM-dependent methyltransferase